MAPNGIIPGIIIMPCIISMPGIMPAIRTVVSSAHRFLQHAGLRLPSALAAREQEVAASMPRHLTPAAEHCARLDLPLLAPVQPALSITPLHQLTHHAWGNHAWHHNHAARPHHPHAASHGHLCRGLRAAAGAATPAACCASTPPNSGTAGSCAAAARAPSAWPVPLLLVRHSARSAVDVAATMGAGACSMACR